MRDTILTAAALTMTCFSMSQAHAVNIPLDRGRPESGRWGTSEVGDARVVLRKQSPVSYEMGGQVIEHISITAQCRDEMAHMGMAVMMYLHFDDGMEEAMDGLMIPRGTTDPVTLTTRPKANRGKPVRNLTLHVDSSAGRQVTITSLDVTFANGMRHAPGESKEGWERFSAGAWTGLWWTDDIVIAMIQTGDRVTARHVSHDGRYQGTYNGIVRGTRTQGQVVHTKAPPNEPRKSFFRADLAPGGATFSAHLIVNGETSEPISGKRLVGMPRLPAIPASGGADLTGIWWDGDEVSIVAQSGTRLVSLGWSTGGRFIGVINDGVVSDGVGKGTATLVTPEGKRQASGKAELRLTGDGTTLAYRAYSQKKDRWATGTMYLVATLTGKGKVARVPTTTSQAVADASPPAKPAEPPAPSNLRTARRPAWGYEFDYPAEWQKGAERPDGVIVFKPNYGQVEARHVKLPQGVTAAQWAQHVAKVYSKPGGPLVFEADLGAVAVGARRAPAHRYTSTDKRGEFLAYHFVTPRSVGVRILIHIDDPASRADLLAVVGSLRYTSAERPAEPAPPARRPAPAPGTRYTTFGEHSPKGKFTGRVFLADIFNKTVYPVYVAIHPVQRVSGSEHSRDPQDYRVSGPPIYTATDGHGNYRTDLQPGTYLGVPYNGEGVPWKLLSGDKIFECSATHRLHHFKIDNKNR